MKTAVLRGLAPLGGRPKAPKGPRPPSREINGYPFTTFTDLSDFLGTNTESLGRTILLLLVISITDLSDFLARMESGQMIL